jgi:hypothetical protein
MTFKGVDDAVVGTIVLHAIARQLIQGIVRLWQSVSCSVSAAGGVPAPSGTS